MKDFKKLVKLLNKELDSQKKLLKLLLKEQVSIINMKQTEISEIAEEKEKFFNKALSYQKEREEVVKKILPEEKFLGHKFDDLVLVCSDYKTKEELTTIKSSLKETVEEVSKINKYNSSLIKQALGVVSSTLSILRTSPPESLPTYTGKGTLSIESQDAAFNPNAKNLTREA